MAAFLWLSERIPTESIQADLYTEFAIGLLQREGQILKINQGRGEGLILYKIERSYIYDNRKKGFFNFL